MGHKRKEPKVPSTPLLPTSKAIDALDYPVVDGHTKGLKIHDSRDRCDTPKFIAHDKKTGIVYMTDQWGNLHWICRNRSDAKALIEYLKGCYGMTDGTGRGNL